MRVMRARTFETKGRRESWGEGGWEKGDEQRSQTPSPFYRIQTNGLSLCFPMRPSKEPTWVPRCYLCPGLVTFRKESLCSLFSSGPCHRELCSSSWRRRLPATLGHVVKNGVICWPTSLSSPDTSTGVLFLRCLSQASFSSSAVGLLWI